MAFILEDRYARGKAYAVQEQGDRFRNRLFKLAHLVAGNGETLSKIDGRRITQHGAALYITGEDEIEDLKEQFFAMGLTNPSKRLSLISFYREDEQLFEYYGEDGFRIGRLWSEHVLPQTGGRDFVLIVFDNVSEMTRIYHGSAAHAEQYCQNQMSDLAEKTGACVLFSHYGRFRKDVKKPSKRMRETWY